MRVTAAAGAQPAPGQGGPGAPAPAPGSSPLVGGCPMFPADNAWNTDISQAAVLDDYTDTFPAAMTLWPDFGGAGEYGIPYVTVPAGPAAACRSRSRWPTSPSPARTRSRSTRPVENGGDRHVLVVREGECKLYELYAAERVGRGLERLQRRDLRPALQRAAARGLDVGRRRRPADPRRARAPRRGRRRRDPPRAAHHRPADVGRLHPPRHARGRVAAPARTRRWACGCGCAPTTRSPGFGPQARAVAQALKTYGALVADNSGGNPNRIYVSGARDLGWDDDDLARASSRSRRRRSQAVRTGPVIPAH